jgi:hypothetical protein
MPFLITPDTDLTKWIPTVVKSLPLPSITREKADIWQLATDSNAGGFAWVLPEPLKGEFTVDWSWRAEHNPKTTSSFLFGLLSRSSDDAAIRLGFVFDYGTAHLPIRAFARSAVTTESSGSIAISHITIVNLLPPYEDSLPEVDATPAPKDGKELPCSRSPHSDHITYCSVHADSGINWSAVHTSKSQLVTRIDPALSKRSVLVALWLFADSDDSASTSRAAINLGSVRLSSTSHPTGD